MVNTFDIPEKSKQKQCDLILNTLREHGSVTPSCGYEHLGVSRLAARIHELRVAGHLIDTRMEFETDSFGIRRRQACYSLKKVACNG